MRKGQKYPKGGGRIRKTLVFDSLSYEKIDSCLLDMLIFESRNISALPLPECMNFLFLKADNKTFLSVLFYDVDDIWIATYENPDNPFAKAKRNDEGQLQY